MKPNSRPEPLIDAPRWLGHWRWRLLLAALLLVPFFVPVPRTLERSVIISALGDRLHVVLLGGVAFFLYWYGPLRGRLLRAALAAAAVGGGIEILQHFVGRQALWHDFFQDLVGIGIATGFVLWRGARSRSGLALFLALALLVPWQLREIPAKSLAAREVRASFPLLADFDMGRGRLLWGGDDGAEISHAVAGGGHGGVLRIATEASHEWPAGGMIRFPRDWSAYDRVLLDVRAVEGGDSVGCTAVVTDHAGYRARAGRYTEFVASPGWRTIALPLRGRLDGADRDLDLEDVFLLKVQIERPEQRTILEIDNVRLD